jgi:hypothetical protein
LDNGGRVCFGGFFMNGKFEDFVLNLRVSLKIVDFEQFCGFFLKFLEFFMG